MVDCGWLSHIPLLFYVPTNLNCVYFNWNFCIENWQQTISFLKLESNLMIKAVSVKKARKLFSIKFVFGFYVGFGEICEKFYLSFCLLLPALIHFLRRKNNQQIAHLSCFFKLDVWLFCCRSSQDPPAPSEAGSDTADSPERYRFLLRDKHETVTSNPEKNRLKRNRDWWGLQIN